MYSASLGIAVAVVVTRAVLAMHQSAFAAEPITNNLNDVFQWLIVCRIVLCC